MYKYTHVHIYICVCMCYPPEIELTHKGFCRDWKICFFCKSM